MELRPLSVRAVILDWDGTLLNSYRADAHAYQAMFRALDIEFSERQLARHYSPDWYRVYRAAKIPKKDWGLADELWAKAYQKERPRLMPGVKVLLCKLNRSYTLGLVTSGDRKRVRRQLRHFGLTEFFRACVCSEDASRRKPHPAPLREAIRRMRMRPAECVYVGDTPEDIEMARRAGVTPVGILGPFPSSVWLKKLRPLILLESISELADVLLPDAGAS